MPQKLNFDSHDYNFGNKITYNTKLVRNDIIIVIDHIHNPIKSHLIEVEHSSTIHR